MDIITSLQNEAIKDIVKLHTSAGRKKQKRFMVEGKRAIDTFITCGYQPLELYCTEDHTFKGATVVSETVMKKISTATTPSGVIAVFSLPDNPPASKLSAGIVLADITDPGNMGTLIRSCAAFGYSSVVIVEGCDPFSPKVIQATAGTLPLVNIFRWRWEELVKNKNDKILCALVVKDGKSFKTVDHQKSLFVIGNEAHGIKKEWLKNCDTFVTLEMPGKTESLNAAVAGSIILASKIF